MSDNCQNSWGCVLSVCSTKFLGTSSYADERVLRDNITATFKNKFVLEQVMSCGSHANMHAIMSATNGDTNAMLVAAGSYVSGDNGTMQTFSSSDFSLATGFSGIADPSKIRNEFTRKHTVALPYFIDGSIDLKAQTSYENSCIKQLHFRCLLALVKKCPIRVIMLELMLASNGTSLSDRFLMMLGNLASQFGIRFIVDEVMTAGRTGKMLMLLHKPEEFQRHVSHVTLGKWTKKGLVLVSRVFYEETVVKSSHTEYRMLSNHIDCRDVLLHWASVRKQLSKHDVVRKKVLAKLKMKEEVTWGQGTLIFAPIRRKGSNEGLLNRLLPQLAENLPLDTINAERNLEGLSKAEINQQTMSTVKKWLNFYSKTDEEDAFIVKLLKYLTAHSQEHLEFKTIMKEVFPSMSEYPATTTIHRMQAADLLVYKMVGLKRKRRWIVSDLCSYKTIIID